ncbi:MAG: mechanosensitive ion channel family protein [Treponema sp.]|jgi:small-conductance mechanosensitive channel|nr:mechanosensitive ion channel family protein [Treponema sp.]
MIRFRSLILVLVLAAAVFPLAAQDGSEKDEAAAEIPVPAVETIAPGSDAGVGNSTETPEQVSAAPPAVTAPAAAPPAPPADDSASGSSDPEQSVPEIPAAAPARTETVTQNIENAVSQNTETMNIYTRIGIALAIVAGQALLIWLVWHLLFQWIAKRTVELGSVKIKPLTIKKLKLLNTKQILDIILFLIKILKYLVTAFQLFITIPLVFSLFPVTKELASTLFGYILTPLKNIFFGTIRYIPNLFTIIVILFVTRYVIRGLKFFAVQIQKGKLVIPGFYVDWAEPTFNILRVLIYAFTVAIIYPYLPGSDSRIFQGVSVFVGIIFSLGSSSAIGNLVAGLVITYMRPFKIGDRIQIQNNIGFVVEKTLIVVRIKTHKNEYITFPNMMILGSSIINFNTSSDEDAEGLILHAEITFGYSTPWQTIHKILIGAALETDHVQKTPKPFVLQTALDDFYARYQINLYTKKVDKVPAIYSELYEKIQNGFRKEGLDMTAAHFRINLPATGEEGKKQQPWT